MAVNVEEVLEAERAAAPPSQTRVVLQVLLAIVTVAAGLWALHRLERVVLVLILATFFAYVIAPLVRFAERPLPLWGRPRRLSRGLAIALVYVLIVSSGGAGAAILWPSVTQQIDDAVARAPSYTRVVPLVGARVDPVLRAPSDPQ